MIFGSPRFTYERQLRSREIKSESGENVTLGFVDI